MLQLQVWSLISSGVVPSSEDNLISCCAAQPFCVLGDIILPWCVLLLQGQVYGLAFANNTLFSAGQDTTIRVWNLNEQAGIFVSQVRATAQGANWLLGCLAGCLAGCWVRRHECVASACMHAGNDASIMGGGKRL